MTIQNESSPHDPGGNGDSRRPTVRVRAILENVMPVFFQNARDITDRMQTALHERELENLERLAHTLKGSSLSFDMNTVGDDCRELEQICRQQDYPAAEALVHRIVSFLDNVDIEYI